MILVEHIKRIIVVHMEDARLARERVRLLADEELRGVLAISRARQETERWKAGQEISLSKRMAAVEIARSEAAAKLDTYERSLAERAYKLRRETEAMEQASLQALAVRAAQTLKREVALATEVFRAEMAAAERAEQLRLASEIDQEMLSFTSELVAAFNEELWQIVEETLQHE